MQNKDKLITELKAEIETLKKVKDFVCINLKNYIADNNKLKAENERLYEEKNCLHKIIDRLLDNAGYSKDIASAEDFEDVYENMQYNRQKLSEYKQTLQEVKEIAMDIMDDDIEESSAYSDARQIIDLITKVESEG